MRTFEDLVEELTSEAVYNGTSVDEATQNALLEWNFDRPLTVQDDDTKWLRYYRRNLNMNYPIYLDLLKAELIRNEVAEMIITELISGSHENDSTSSDSKSDTHTFSKTGQDSEHTVTDNTSVRTPDLSTDVTNSNLRTDNLFSESNGTDTGSTERTDNLRSVSSGTDATREQRTDNLRSVSSGTDTGTNTRTDNLRTQTTGSDTGTVGNTGSSSSDVDSQTRAVAITYPEANMGSIPSSISGFPASIDYAEGESDTFATTDSSETTSNTETRNLSNSSDTTNTGTVTDLRNFANSNDTANTGTVTNTKDISNATDTANTGTVTEDRDLASSMSTANTGTVSDAGTSSTAETGTDTTEFDGDVTKTGSRSESSTDTITGTGSGTNHDEGTNSVEGRHESTADLLPKIVQAIVSTNAIKWLVKQTQVCFDNYAEM